MKIKVMQYLTPKQQSEFYGNKKTPVARPELKKKTQSKLNTFNDELKRLLEK